jgi:hypothetical protein
MPLRTRLFVTASVVVWLKFGCVAFAQENTDVFPDPALADYAPEPPEPIALPLNEERILKVIPDYQTVEDSSRPVAPLTRSQKWNLGWREAADPFNTFSAGLTAGFAQRENQTPKYGEGWSNYGKRFGAAVADFGTQSLFSAGLFANLLNEDPRYFRKGPSAGVLPRVLYSVTRLLICRSDAGKPVFNGANFLGMGAGIAVSNLYYPSASRTGTVMAGRIETSLFGGITGNLLSEFWPDVQRKLFHKKTRY